MITGVLIGVVITVVVLIGLALWALDVAMDFLKED